MARLTDFHRQHLLYHIVAYLVSLDKLFDDQAKLLREQISWAEQVEVTVRMHQVRVAQAEARTAAAISSEAVAHESLRRIQDQRMQEWTNSGTPFWPLEKHKSCFRHPL
jgi:predicted butyrate kinase (DUF1464 family)